MFGLYMIYNNIRFYIVWVCMSALLMNAHYVQHETKVTMHKYLQDGNLVVYDETNRPLWDSQTDLGNHPSLPSGPYELHVSVSVEQ